MGTGAPNLRRLEGAFHRDSPRPFFGQKLKARQAMSLGAVACLATCSLASALAFVLTNDAVENPGRANAQRSSGEPAITAQNALSPVDTPAPQTLGTSTPPALNFLWTTSVRRALDDYNPAAPRRSCPHPTHECRPMAAGLRTPCCGTA
jgi:hypothetical protein